MKFTRPRQSESESDITPFNMLQAAPSPSGVESPTTLPMLPPEEVGQRLIEAAYLYTQARYCIVDWVRIREWHQQREEICYVSSEDSLELQIGTETESTSSGRVCINKVSLHLGAFFIWIIYAIGARFSANHEHASPVSLSLLILLRALCEFNAGSLSPTLREPERISQLYFHFAT